MFISPIIQPPKIILFGSGFTRIERPSFALVLLIFLFIGGPSSGQPADHSHVSLIRNNSLNFDLLVSAAVERSSERLLRASRQNQASAYEAASDGLLPGQYTLQASMFDDGITGNKNIRELKSVFRLGYGVWEKGKQQNR